MRVETSPSGMGLMLKRGNPLAAARQFRLDFVRLITEDYFFVCRKSAPEDDSVKRAPAIRAGRRPTDS